jgi:TolB protein
MRHFKLFQVIVISTVLLSAYLMADKGIDLGELSREERNPVLPISIESNIPEVEVLAKRAFDTHGAYKIEPRERLFTFELNSISPTEIDLKIESHPSKQVQYQGKFQGKSLTEATLKACDAAVQKTLGIPGFFSGKITFVGHRNKKNEIFTGDLFFKNIRQLTHDGVDVVFPKWSPDGKNIIYTSFYKTGFPDIFIMNASNGEKKTVAAYTGTNIGGVYSPNGEKIAMILSSSGNPELYVANSNGHGPKRLTTTKALEAAPSWSPDGKNIYFSCDALGAPQIYVINVNGEDMKRVPTNISRYCDEPAVNPRDAKQIAFTAATSGGFQTAIFDLDSQESHFITEGKTDHIEPCWTNDGRHLLVTRRNGGISELYVIDSKTGKETAIHSKDFGNASMASFVY